MKTKINKILGLCALGLFAFTSCDSFLDQQETERMTFEKIWEKRSYTQGYYIKCFNWMPDLYNPPAFIGNGAADEASASWSTSNYAFSAHNNGSWNVSSVAGSNLKDMYAAIRHCTMFMQNIDKCTAFDVLEPEKKAWKADARFLRAYYYYLAMVQHGPVFLMGETLIDPITSTMEENALPRSPWDDCVAYVMSELDTVGEVVPSRYPATDPTNLGRPTKTIIKALKARLALYSARPLFNDGGGYLASNSVYKSLKQYPNGTGEQLFPDYDPEKWRVAADLCKEAIDTALDNGFKIYMAPQKAGETYNPYQSLFGVVDVPWNDEIIWGRYQGRGQWTVHIKPRGIQGTAYGGYGPTQRHVDRYATVSGVYPFSPFDEATYDAGNPKVDHASAYDEEGWTTFGNPAGKKGNAPEASEATYKAGDAVSTFNMYVNREPRFYCNIYWSGARWPQIPYKQCFFHTGAGGIADGGVASGPPHHDHPWTGYMVVKGLDRTGNLDKSSDAPNAVSWPYIRVAELYLNYAEALNECDPGNTDVLKYLNEVRVRAGLPKVGASSAGGEQGVYADAIGDIDKQRALILREREIELAFEGHRFDDARTLMQAGKTNHGPVYGMNKLATDPKPDGDFWKRAVIQNRIFLFRHYLFPFQQNLLDRNKNITQNYGW